MPQKLAEVYTSQGKAYKHAFEVFLKHTNQKKVMRMWVSKLIDTLHHKHTFIDAGAGEGESTSWFSPSFEKTIAIEPNPYLLEKLKKKLPHTIDINKEILDARPEARGDLILCSHVFYYIPKEQWMQHLEKLASWTSPSGVLVIVLQNAHTDCMEMLDHFFEKHFDLSELIHNFNKKHSSHFESSIERAASHVVTEDFESAYTIAEFMLNLLPITDAPSKKDLEEYVRTHFQEKEGKYRFSCDQDFVKIIHRPKS